jgi:hypothetical protein
VEEDDGNHPRDRDRSHQYAAVAANVPNNEEGPEEEEEEDDDDDEYGPNLPSTHPRPGPSSGPTIPTTQDLELRKGAIQSINQSRRPMISC